MVADHTEDALVIVHSILRRERNNDPRAAMTINSALNLRKREYIIRVIDKLERSRQRRIIDNIKQPIGIVV